MDLFSFDKLSSVSGPLIAGAKTETESTLSNVTSLQSHSQSLYDCDLINQHLINNNEQLVIVHTNSSNKSLIKKYSAATSASLGGIKGAGGGTIQTAAKVHKPTKDAYESVPVAAARKRSCGNTIHSNETEGDNVDVHPTGHADSTLVNNSKTATILVSKTKTKTGLPLLLKNSIN